MRKHTNAQRKRGTTGLSLLYRKSSPLLTLRVSVFVLFTMGSVSWCR
jgi:hypothetical protein